MDTSGIDIRLPYVATLLRDKAYRTPGPTRPGILPGIRYYVGLLRIIVVCSLIARRRRFTNQDYFNRAYDMLNLVESLGGSIEITGAEHLASVKGGAVVVSNHMSLLETFLLPAVLFPFNPMGVVLKEELTRYFGFGKAMRDINHIAVSRDNPRADFRTVMEEGLAYLKAGIQLLIFPQATRNPVFIPSEFNTLGEKLAAKAGVPVIPIAVKTDLHGTGRKRKDIGPVNPALPVRVAIGPPLDSQQNGRLLHEQVLAFITGRLREWGLPIQAETPPPRS